MRRMCAAWLMSGVPFLWGTDMGSNLEVPPGDWVYHVPPAPHSPAWTMRHRYGICGPLLGAGMHTVGPIPVCYGCRDPSVISLPAGLVLGALGTLAFQKWSQSKFPQRERAFLAEGPGGAEAGRHRLGVVRGQLVTGGRGRGWEGQAAREASKVCVGCLCHTDIGACRCSPGQVERSHGAGWGHWADRSETPWMRQGSLPAWRGVLLLGTCPVTVGISGLESRALGASSSGAGPPPAVASWIGSVSVSDWPGLTFFHFSSHS